MLSATGRARKVVALDDEIVDLCLPVWGLGLPPLEEGPENDYRKLVNELMGLMVDQQLFTFVTAPPVTQPNGQTEPVSGTNNEGERTLRGSAQARETERTNKTRVGARRQTIIVSVLESLRVYLPTFTLSDVINEIDRWWQAGQSCVTELLKKMGLPPPSESVLDKVLHGGRHDPPRPGLWFQRLAG